MLAEIAERNRDAADIFFLIGLILGFAAAILTAVARVPASGTVNTTRPVNTLPVWAPVLAYGAVGCVAFGLMLQ